MQFTLKQVLSGQFPHSYTLCILLNLFHTEWQISTRSQQSEDFMGLGTGIRFEVCVNFMGAVALCSKDLFSFEKKERLVDLECY